MKVGRIKDPLYKDSYFGITPPTFIPPFEAPELSVCRLISGIREGSFLPSPKLSQCSNTFPECGDHGATGQTRPAAPSTAPQSRNQTSLFLTNGLYDRKCNVVPSDSRRNVPSHRPPPQARTSNSLLVVSNEARSPKSGSPENPNYGGPYNDEKSIWVCFADLSVQRGPFPPTPQTAKTYPKLLQLIALKPKTTERHNPKNG